MKLAQRVNCRSIMLNFSQPTVFPDPVWAQAIKSRLAIIIGIACFCTGVGFVYPDFVTFSKTNGRRPEDPKELIAAGMFSPVT